MKMTKAMRSMFYSFLISLALVSIAHARPLVRQIRSAQEFDRLVEKHARSTGLPVVADFYSDGCGPCRMMAPVFKKLAKEYQDKAVFVKIDTNQVHQLSSRYSVRSIPTFISFYNGKKANEFSGAGEQQLRQMASSAVDQAEYENVVLTRESLAEYYQTQDPSKTQENVDSVYQKCVDMMKNKQITDCVGAAAQKLSRNLRKKYKSAPTLVPRFTEVDRQSKTNNDKAKAKPDSSSAGASTSTKSKSSGASDKPNLNLATIEELEKELAARREAMAEAELEAQDEDEDEDAEFQHGWAPSDFPERVTIIGGGPAGIAAAIYAARAGLEPVVVAPPMGGQLQGKGVDVENYPGMVNVTGPAVVATMRTQAASFGAVFEAETVLNIDTSTRPLKVITNTSTIETHTVILATGAESNWLGVKGEWEMRGGGVSTCATCDGHFYKDTHVLVVGGGDTAMEDALVLARTSKTVTIIHRRDTFRASKVLAQRVIEHPSIKIKWNTTVEEVLGEASANDPSKQLVTGAILKDVTTGKSITQPCEAVFVAIGHTPTTKFVEGVVEFDMKHSGYIQTFEGSTRTSVPGIFAAGDVADSIYRQAITSAGSGAAAALDAERYLSEEGLGNEQAEFEAELLREMMEDMPSKAGSGLDDVYNVYADAGSAAKGYKESVGAEL